MLADPSMVTRNRRIGPRRPGPRNLDSMCQGGTNPTRNFVFLMKQASGMTPSPGPRDTSNTRSRPAGPEPRSTGSETGLFLYYHVSGRDQLDMVDIAPFSRKSSVSG